MKLKGSILGATLAAVLTGAGLWGLNAQAQSVSFTINPYFMKPLPNFWFTGVVSGTCLGTQNHILILSQGFQTGGNASPEGVGGANITGVVGSINQSKAAPPVIEFDQNGYIFNSWGNPALVAAGQPFAGQNAVLPNGLHGCFVDSQGNVWVAGTGDGVVQKYPPSGGTTPSLTIGVKFACDSGAGGSVACTGTGGGNQGKLGTSTTLLNTPATVAVDPNPDPVTGQTGSVYIADQGNHRVAVFSGAGTYLRQMGTGVGAGAGQFSSAGGTNCVALPNNGMVYACDRGNDRINVFTKAGTFVKSMPVIPGTAALPTNGSASYIAFSPDSAQTFMYVADGGNELAWIMNHAQALAATPGVNPIIGSFGFGAGHNTGYFTFLDTIAVDTNGNAYAAETAGGRRLQAFQVTQH